MALSLSDADINSLLESDPYFLGVNMNDEKLDLQSTGYHILNLQNSNQGGSHWTLLYHKPFGFIYSDPFGSPPTKKIMKILKATGEPIMINKRIYQSIKSSYCGYFSMITAQLLRGCKSREEVSKVFDTELSRYKEMLDTREQCPVDKEDELPIQFFKDLKSEK